MHLRAKIKTELDGTVIAEVAVSNYDGELVIWNRPFPAAASSKEQARKAIEQYMARHVYPSLGSFSIVVSVHEARKGYTELYKEGFTC